MRARPEFELHSRGKAATIACLLEVSAPKPGNVSPGADFNDVTYDDFRRSAILIGPILDRALRVGVGQTILDAVRATKKAVGTNTNLGTLLLLAPLAAVPDGVPMRAGIERVLANLTLDDTRHVYEAIRTSTAGGLGTVREADVADDPPPNLHLVDAMKMAADIDLVARQYTNSFADVLSGTAEWIAEGWHKWRPDQAIVHAHVRQLAAHGDSLIVRKCGQPTSDEARRRASLVLAAGFPGEKAYQSAISELDRWLKGDGHRRNPGTSADFIAAGLFVCLRDARIELCS
jgi:triphosphoribosyl-dephospho-CoA synthase